MNKYKNINNLVLFITSIILSISVIGITNYALSIDVDYLNFGTKSNSISLIELSKDDKINLGCNKINDQLFQSQTPFVTASELSTQASNIVSETTLVESEYLANLASIFSSINDLPSDIETNKITNLFDAEANTILDKFNTSINAQIDKLLELRNNVSKSQINLLYNKTRQKTLSSIGYLKKSFNLSTSRILATSFTPKLTKSLVTPLLESLVADSQKVLASIINDFSNLETIVANNTINVSKTELVDNLCKFTITTEAESFELNIPLILDPVCKSKVNPNDYYLDNNQCIKIN
jgi:paraquat-inducible protein B